MIGVRVLLVGAVALVLLGAPTAVVAAAGPVPSEACVPGTVWEDPGSGVKYLCIYDEVFGGPRWVLLSDGQRGTSGMPYRSTVDGCLHLAVGLSALSGGGARCRRPLVSLAVHERIPRRPADRRAAQPGDPAAIWRKRLDDLPRYRLSLQHERGLRLGRRRRHGDRCGLRQRVVSRPRVRIGLPGRRLAGRYLHDAGRLAAVRAAYAALILGIIGGLWLASRALPTGSTPAPTTRHCRTRLGRRWTRHRRAPFRGRRGARGPMHAGARVRVGSRGSSHRRPFPTPISSRSSGRSAGDSECRPSWDGSRRLKRGTRTSSAWRACRLPTKSVFATPCTGRARVIQGVCLRRTTPSSACATVC